MSGYYICSTGNIARIHATTTYLTIVANLERSRRCAASAADTMAPSSAERSHISSVTKNFLARLKKAAGPLEALTAITCLGLVRGSSGVSGDVVVVSDFDTGSDDFVSGFPDVAAGFLSSASAVSCRGPSWVDDCRPTRLEPGV